MTTSDPEFLARFEQLGRFFMGTSDVHVALARLGEHFGDQFHPHVQPEYRELWGYAQNPNDLPE